MKPLKWRAFLGRRQEFELYERSAGTESRADKHVPYDVNNALFIILQEVLCPR